MVKKHGHKGERCHVREKLMSLSSGMILHPACRNCLMRLSDQGTSQPSEPELSGETLMHTVAQHLYLKEKPI